MHSMKVNLFLLVTVIGAWSIRIIVCLCLFSSSFIYLCIYLFYICDYTKWVDKKHLQQLQLNGKMAMPQNKKWFVYNSTSVTDAVPLRHQRLEQDGMPNFEWPKFNLIAALWCTSERWKRQPTVSTKISIIIDNVSYFKAISSIRRNEPLCCQ